MPWKGTISGLTLEAKRVKKRGSKKGSKKWQKKWRKKAQKSIFLKKAKKHPKWPFLGVFRSPKMANCVRQNGVKRTPKSQHVENERCRKVFENDVHFNAEKCWRTTFWPKNGQKTCFGGLKMDFAVLGLWQCRQGYHSMPGTTRETPVFRHYQDGKSF